eukprot:Sdes_comp18954_c0_seq2m9470
MSSASTSSAPKVPRFASTGATDICYDDTGEFIITGGADGTIRIFKGYEDEEALEIDQHEEPITVVKYFDSKIYSGSEDHSAVCHTLKHPNFEFECNITRFCLPVRHLAIGPCAEYIAICSDEPVIKIISGRNQTQINAFHGHEKPVTSLAFDPENMFLASSALDGKVCLWNILEGKCVKTFPGIVPKSNSLISCRMDWQPQGGKFLAIPSGNEIVMVERDSWKKSFSLKDTNLGSEPFLIASWSSSQRFL